MNVSLWLSMTAIVVGSSLPAVTILAMQDGAAPPPAAAMTTAAAPSPIAFSSLAGDDAFAAAADNAVLSTECPAAERALRVLRVIVIEERTDHPTPLTLERPAVEDAAGTLSET